MSDGTKIEWTEATWNPVTGCSVLSPGCTNCYAMKLAGTRLRHHASREGLTRETKAGPVWTGEVRFNEQWLDQPLRWKRPRMIFVCAHGDLFHESVPDAWIDRVFAVMALAPHHTFQVLTKRSVRMREYLAKSKVVRRIYTAAHAHRFSGAAPDPDRFPRKFHAFMAQSARDVAWTVQGGLASDMFERDEPGRDFPTWVRWPLPNVWLGVSVEDQARADERVPDLLATPAAVRWLSCEPLLGSVNIRHALIGQSRLDWIVAGGESGPGARPMHPDWARSLRDQCSAAGVPFFFKQWGAWSPLKRARPADREHGAGMVAWADGTVARCQDYRGRNLLGTQLYLATKAIAGRELDGQLHDAMPA